MSTNRQVLSDIQRLPDNIDFRDVSEEIAMLAAVQEAEDDIREGRLVLNGELKNRIEEWLHSSPICFTGRTSTAIR